jgi:hypothetical protein
VVWLEIEAVGEYGGNIGDLDDDGESGGELVVEVEEESPSCCFRGACEPVACSFIVRLDSGDIVRDGAGFLVGALAGVWVGIAAGDVAIDLGGFLVGIAAGDVAFDLGGFLVICP